MAAIVLPNDHIFLTSESDMKTIVDPFLTRHKIKFFDFGRIYHAGRFCMLSPNAQIIDYGFNHDVPYAPGPEELLGKNKFRYLIKEEGVYLKALHDLKAHFGLGNFLNIVHRHEDYIDVFCFVGASIDFYLSHTDLLDNFVDSFKEQAQHLIHAAANNSVQLPDFMIPNLVKKQPEKKVALLDIHGNIIQFTHREMQMLNYVKKGFTAQTIAKRVSISHRTVEHHIENIKNKIGVKSKASLMEFLSTTLA